MKYSFFKQSNPSQSGLPAFTKVRGREGFTLVETLVAIFILALTIGALLTLTAGGFFAIRYAKNDIVATNLLQESLEYVRNNRDTASQQRIGWDAWIARFSSEGCFEAEGCSINPYSGGVDEVVACDPVCDNMTYYANSGFYGYGSSNLFDSGKPYKTSFIRTITMKNIAGAEPQVIVTARIVWMNGTNQKQLSQSIILSNWNLQ